MGSGRVEIQIVPIGATSTRKKLLVVLAVVVLLVVAAISIAVFVSNENDAVKPAKQTGEIVVEHGAVAADSEVCSKLGRDFLKSGGNAVDAAIAALVCSGVVNLHSTGIGGGGFLTLYNATTNKATIYDYRETGPAGLTNTSFDKDKTLSKVGGMAVGVPGTIRGLKKLHDAHGKKPWKEIFDANAKLARDGTKMGKHMHKYFVYSKSTQAAVKADPGLTELLVNSDGSFKALYSILKNENYAKTLEKVGEDPEDFYTGELAKQYVKDVKAQGGVMTMDDLKNYEVKIREPLTNDFLGMKMYTTPLPGGGSVLASMLNINEGFNFTAKDKSTTEKKILTYHRMVEGMKFSYAKRPHLGDVDTVPASEKSGVEKAEQNIKSKAEAKKCRSKINDAQTNQTNSYYDDWWFPIEGDGTSHVVALDAEGNAVSATETINFAFGAKFRSLKTGIIYNNEMADYFFNQSYPADYKIPKRNLPGAGRRPLSSTCPTIFVDNEGKVKMVVGGSGGTRITLSTAWVIMNKLVFGMSLEDSVEDARPQHCFFPEYIREETTVPLDPEIKKGLIAKGHTVKQYRYSAVIQAIYVDDNKKIHAKSDSRKEGKAAGY